MGREDAPSTQLRRCLERLRAGEDAARAELIDYSCQRVHRLAHRLLQRYPAVRRWEQTDDVLQSAMIRLYRALTEVHPDSVAGLMGLAAQQIRRTLIDLARHHMGPGGTGRPRVRSMPMAPGVPSGSFAFDPADETAGPETLAEWTEFHELVERLPDQERQVFDLRYYAGLSHAEVARTLGISPATAKRRWQSARLLLHAALQERPPR